MSNKAVMKLPTNNEFAETCLRAVQMNRREIINILGSHPGKDRLLRFCEHINAQFEVLETSLSLYLAHGQRELVKEEEPVVEEEAEEQLILTP